MRAQPAGYRTSPWPTRCCNSNSTRYGSCSRALARCSASIRSRRRTPSPLILNGPSSYSGCNRCWSRASMAAPSSSRAGMSPDGVCPFSTISARTCISACR